MKHPLPPLPQLLTQDIGDASLPYLLYDSPGPTVIMLHATGFLPWLWHPIARRLLPDCRVIAPYFADHRECDPDTGGMNWMILAQDFAAFCQRLDIRTPLLVGHSMGATIMTLATARCGLTPASMILIEPIYLPQDLYGDHIRTQDHPLAAKAIKRRDAWRDEKEAVAYLKSKSLFRNWNEEMLSLYVRFGMKPAEGNGLQLACSPRHEASLFVGSLRHDPWPLLPDVSCPVLVLEGERSENRSFIDLKKVVSLLPEATYRMIPASGHLIPMEKPEEIVAVIQNFFNLTPKVKK